MPFRRWLRALSLVVGPLAMTACGLLATHTPDWASDDVFAPDASGQSQTWVFSATGDTYLQYFYESVEDGTMLEASKGEDDAKGILQAVKGVVDDLRGLESQGGTYALVASGNKIRVQIGRPGENIAAATGRKALDLIGAGDSKHASALEATLNTGLPIATYQMSQRRQQVDYRLYGAVHDLDSVESGRELSFSLPADVTPEQYADMLRVLIAQLGSADEFLRGIEASTAGAILAVRGAGSANPRSIANVEAVLLAAAKDTRSYQERRAALKDYPPPAAVKTEAIAKGKELAKEVRATQAYRDWVEGSHAGRKLADFAGNVNVAVKAFSAMSGMMMGFDPYDAAEGAVTSAAQLDFVAATKKLAIVAPKGSKLRERLEKGAQLTEKAKATAQAAEGAAAGQPGAILTLVGTDEEVAKIRDELSRALP